MKAAYRFFDNDYVRAEAVLDSHVQATVQRLQAVPLVLAVQDTTYLDWTDHAATTGLGPLATATHQGLLVHSTLALTPEHVPLGCSSNRPGRGIPPCTGRGITATVRSRKKRVRNG